MTLSSTSGRLRWLATSAVAVTLAGVLVVAPAPGTAPQASGPSGPTARAVTTARAPVATGEPLTLVSAIQRHRRPAPAGRRTVLYRVRPGDTATGLAVRFHAWTAELRAVNHLGHQAMLVVGERIRIPVVVAAHRRFQARSQARSHARSQARSRHRPSPRTHRARPPWRHADASRARVRRTVRLIARRHGVDPRLALAISWQESGWQQRRRSSAGAIGAMQVLPGTGRWMSLYADRPLNLYGLHDNVTAGVVLFKVLRTQTGWRRSIAAYYQGLGALGQHGVYPSSRRYVRSVVAHYLRLRQGRDPA